MDHSSAYRLAQRSLLRAIREAVANVPPAIAESSTGRAMVVATLVSEAVNIMREDASVPMTRMMIETLAAGALDRPDQAGR